MEKEMSAYCRPGAFHCPYRNGQVDYPEGLCDGCDLKYTKEESEELFNPGLH